MGSLSPGQLLGLEEWDSSVSSISSISLAGLREMVAQGGWRGGCRKQSAFSYTAHCANALTCTMS